MRSDQASLFMDVGAGWHSDFPGMTLSFSLFWIDFDFEDSFPIKVTVGTRGGLFQAFQLEIQNFRPLFAVCVDLSFVEGSLSLVTRYFYGSSGENFAMGVTAIDLVDVSGIISVHYSGDFAVTPNLVIYSYVELAKWMDG
jgi:hypothetical protein